MSSLCQKLESHTDFQYVELKKKSHIYFLIHNKPAAVDLYGIYRQTRLLIIFLGYFLFFLEEGQVDL